LKNIKKPGSISWLKFKSFITGRAVPNDLHSTLGLLAYMSYCIDYYLILFNLKNNQVRKALDPELPILPIDSRLMLGILGEPFKTIFHLSDKLIS
jgi:hypothetical protein